MTFDIFPATIIFLCGFVVFFGDAKFKCEWLHRVANGANQLTSDKMCSSP